MSKNACEYVLHGRDDKQQCCPHSVTRKQGPPDECCVDDMQRTPYRLRYLHHDLKNEETTYTFDIKITNPDQTEYDGAETANCDKMSLDYVQIQICEFWVTSKLRIIVQGACVRHITVCSAV